jgi:ABC-type multidrug transport system ATPase subunit
LDNLSGSFKAGTSTAILGPSGSGKTTLLNFLSDRMGSSSALKVNGKLFLNGSKIDSIQKIKHRISYVMQQDIMFEDMTPEEQLLSTAKLAGVPNPEKRVEEVVSWLGLESCKDTRVGSVMVRGISGGEKKRTSIGLEIITNPSLIFLDEPTTGLDSKSALDVVNIIKMLAENGRTIISTIHQPSSEVLARYDRVMCLCEGNLVYDGTPDNIPSYFTEIGMAPKEHTNPADHLMTILNEDDIKLQAFNEGRDISEKEVKEQFQKRVKDLKSAYESKRSPIVKKKSSSKEFEALLQRERKTSLSAQFCVMVKRNYQFMMRNPQGVILKTIQSIAFGIFNIILYIKILNPKDDTVSAIQDRLAMAFNITSSSGFGGVFGSFLGIIPILGPFKRDHQKRLYSPQMFYWLSTLYHIPVEIFVNVVYLLSFFYFIEIEHSWAFLWKFFVILMSGYVAASGYGDILSILIADIELINQAFPVLVIPFFMIAGMLGSVRSLLLPLRILSYGSFFRFSFQAGVVVIFHEEEKRRFTESCFVKPPGCSDTSCVVQNLGNPACDPDVLTEFYETDYWTNIFILLAQAVIYRILSSVIFHYKMKNKEMPYAQLPDKRLMVMPSEAGKLSNN